MSAALLSSPRDYLLLFLLCCLVICIAAIVLGRLAYKATTQKGRGYPRAGIPVPERLDSGRVEPVDFGREIADHLASCDRTDELRQLRRAG